MMRNHKSITVILLIGMIYAFSMHAYKPYRTLYLQRGGDALGYYVYLPAFFIHHDLGDLHGTMLAKYKHASPGEIVGGIAPSLQAEAPPAPNGRPVIKYTMGTAVMEAPFFLLAHALAGLFHQPRDGMSWIYMYAMEASVLIYVLAGFLILALILRRFFSDTVIALTLIAIGLGTNLYFLVSFNSPMSHPFLFFLYALLIYVTISFYDTLDAKFALMIGFCCGMVTLTRANEAYVILIPLLWGIRSGRDIRQRFRLVAGHLPAFTGAACMFILCLLPQIIYWKLISGHFIYYSYGEEKFSFLHPHIFAGLFSFENGWLAYSPVMYLALIGIWFVYYRRNGSFAPLIVFLPVHVYVIYSWWCWFYMGSYGSRPMTEAYPILSIPLAYTVDQLWRSWPKKSILTGAIVFFCWLTVFQTYQTSLNIFDSVMGNWRYNLISFGKTKLTYDEAIVMDTREYQPKHPVLVKQLCTNNYEDTTIPGSSTRVFLSGSRSICLRAGQYCDGCKMTLDQAHARSGQWVEASVSSYALATPFNLWEQSSLVVEFFKNGKMVKWTQISLQNKIDNPNHGIWSFQTGKWGKANFYTQIPTDLGKEDVINVFLWNGNPQAPDIYIDDLSVELYDNQ